jgi:lipoprotein-releasing system ATP-binding protein
MSSVLEVWNLCKSFPTPAGAVLEVLRGINLTANGGEILAVTGPSGAGKSTLLQLLGGLDVPDAGTVRLDQFEVSGARARPLADFRAREVGFVFQSHRLLPDLTAGENVALSLAINRLGWRSAREKALAALGQVGLADRADDAIGHLSGGEQQRVALARGLASQPKLVLADEPTGNLDADAGAVIGDLLIDYCRTRQAIVIIATHNEYLATRCDRTLHLSLPNHLPLPVNQ